MPLGSAKEVLAGFIRSEWCTCEETDHRVVRNLYSGFLSMAVHIDCSKIPS
jgi:hypothetical protein